MPSVWDTVLAGVLPDSDDPQDEVMYLWPDNRGVWAHWCAVQTQWRVGMAGRTGLDYAAVCAYLALHEPDAELQREHLVGIRAAEWASLETWNTLREAAEARNAQ